MKLAKILSYNMLFEVDPFQPNNPSLSTPNSSKSDEDKLSEMNKRLALLNFKIHHYEKKLDLWSTLMGRIEYDETRLKNAGIMKPLKIHTRYGNDAFCADTPRNRYLDTLIVKTFPFAAAYRREFDSLTTRKNKLDRVVTLKSLPDAATTKQRIAQAVSSGSVSYDPKTLTPNIKFGTTRAMQPYFMGNSKQFVGHPLNCPAWSSNLMKVMFVELESILRKYKVPLFDVMYMSADTNVRCSNFILINETKTVMWRKYDRGGGTGQNWIYFNAPGQKTVSIATAGFLLLTPTEYHALLDPIAVKTP